MVRKLIDLFSFFSRLTSSAAGPSDRFRLSAGAFSRRFTVCYRRPFPLCVCFGSYPHKVQCKSGTAGSLSPLWFGESRARLAATRSGALGITLCCAVAANCCFSCYVFWDTLISA